MTLGKCRSIRLYASVRVGVGTLLHAGLREYYNKMRLLKGLGSATRGRQHHKAAASEIGAGHGAAATQRDRRLVLAPLRDQQWFVVSD